MPVWQAFNSYLGSPTRRLRAIGDIFAVAHARPARAATAFPRATTHAREEAIFAALLSL